MHTSVAVILNNTMKFYKKKENANLVWSLVECNDWKLTVTHLTLLDWVTYKITEVPALWLGDL